MTATPPGPVVVSFPLRGEWVAVRTPAHRVPSHGTDLLGQRYAFDFVRPDQRPGLHLHPPGTRRTRDFYGWGQPVHAAFDGEVVQAVDGVAEPERVSLVRDRVRALRNAARLDPARGLEPLAGNHVIMRGRDAFAVFAHVAPGTVSVGVGQAVRAGQVVGRVGDQERRPVGQRRIPLDPDGSGGDHGPPRRLGGTDAGHPSRPPSGPVPAGPGRRARPATSRRPGGPGTPRRRRGRRSPATGRRRP